MAISEAKKKATKKWNDKNKEKMRYYYDKSATKRFILTKAQSEDLSSIAEWVDERKVMLAENKEKNNEKEN